MLSFLTRAIRLTTLPLLLAVWSLRPPDLAAQSLSQPDELSGVLGAQLAITEHEIEQRARLFALSANIGTQAKENFQHLVKSKGTEDRMRTLQQEVIDTNPGKTREELIAIFQNRQKEFGLALQKQALKEAREALMPKLRTDARRELIDERLILEAARRSGVEVSDDDVRAHIQDLAGRNQMTYEQFAQHLNDMGAHVATLGEKFRARQAWRKMLEHNPRLAPHLTK